MASAAAAPPDPAGSGLRLEGFATLGVAHADMNPRYSFLREILQPASTRDTRADVDSRLGLQLNWRPDPRWSVVAQGVLRRRAAGSPADEALDLAFAAWHPAAGIDLRVGRMALDAFLLADYRHVGFAYPWVRPSPEFYGWIPLQSFDGADASWRFEDAGGASWRAKLLAGRGRTTIPGPTGVDVKLRVSPVLGAVLTREADGLLLKASYVHARSRLDPTPQVTLLLQGLRGVQALPLPAVAAEARELERQLLFDWFVARYAGLGASYEHGAWQLHAEASWIDADHTANDGVHAYLSVGRRIGEFTVFVAAARARSSVDRVAAPDWASTLGAILGPALGLQAQALADAATAGANAGRQDQRSWTLGARWDFDARRALKLQVDRVRIGAYGSGLWGGSGPPASRGTVVAVALDVVF